MVFMRTALDFWMLSALGRPEISFLDGMGILVKRGRNS